MVVVGTKFVEKVLMVTCAKCAVKHNESINRREVCFPKCEFSVLEFQDGRLTVDSKWQIFTVGETKGLTSQQKRRM